ncbi:isochorismate synthase [Corynebacterium sp. H127]|uniref:isochorismate synthase n=1 Tax=Corynebacterium sp. H127 TaxID=3133418 RepID=UPI0030AF5C58
MSNPRPSTAPDFLLSRSHGSVRTQGSLETYTDAWDAAAALKAGKHDMIVGALPFLRDAPAALTVPAQVIREDGPLEPHSYYRMGPGSELSARVTGFDPSPAEHVERVAAAVSTLSSTLLEKVVLARAVDIRFSTPVDPRLVAARLIDNSHNCDGFIADLSPVGRGFLVGSSPEVLIKRQGSTVSAYPLAGSAPRVDDPVADHLAGANLQASAKDLSEHRFVVEHLQRILTPLCSSLSVPDQPELTKTDEMWHLATPIVGTLAQPTTALELALRVHPTPAICGTPVDAAEALIESVETPRGFYAGAVGWCDNAGDGEYMVAIRCAEVSPDGLTARAWAGGGIVSSSSPAAELAETDAKLRTIMRALGLGSQNRR